MVFRPKANKGSENITHKLLLEQVLREKNRRRVTNLRSYHDWLNTLNDNFNWNFSHTKYIAQKMDAVTRREIKRIAFFLPPQHGKSETVTIRYAVYLLELNPKTRIVIAAYASHLAEKFSRAIRTMVQERGIVELDESRTSVEEWLTRQGGGIRVVGVGGSITGFSADVIIIDDPIKGYAASRSKATRDEVYNWYRDDIYTRQQKDTPIVLIQTRWHEDDLAGRILSDETEDEEYQWKVISLPAICEGSDPEDYPVKREIGEALCEDLHPLSQLKEMQRLQKESFAALYQQRPSPVEGDVWKRSWFTRDGKDDGAIEFVARFPDVKRTQVWDTALEVKQRNDFSALVEGCFHNGFIYVAAMVNEKLAFPELVNRMRTERERCSGEKGVDTCIEDKASGKPARQQLKTQGIPIIEIPAGTTDKEVRAKSVTPYAEARHDGIPGVRFVSEPGNCNAVLIDQLFVFPNGRHDDLHDAFVHLLRRITGKATKWNKDTMKKIFKGVING